MALKDRPRYFVEFLLAFFLIANFALMPSLAQPKLDLQEIRKRKNILYPKPKNPPIKAVRTKPATTEAAPTQEALVQAAAEAAAEKKITYNLAVGVSTGLFAGATGVLGEVRLPLRIVFGPASLGLRAAGGYLQSASADLRYIPVCADAIFNFPPGWFSGVDNYVGAGLNYIALMSGRKQGTIGGEIFYGVESTGFGGIVFGELGYGLLRTGFSPSNRGVTVLVGYRAPLDL